MSNLERKNDNLDRKNDEILAIVKHQQKQIEELRQQGQLISYSKIVMVAHLSGEAAWLPRGSVLLRH